MKRFLAAMILFLCFAADASRAGDAPPPPPVVPADPAVEEGLVNAASLRPLRDANTFSVRGWDNLEDTAELGRHIEDQLRLRGFTVSAEAPLVLKFSATDTLGEWSSGPRRRLVEIDGQAGSDSENEAQVRLNLFSSDKGGVFNEGRPPDRVPSSYSLEMTIDRADGQRLWQGEATAKLAKLDRRQLVKLMVPPLLDNIGKTVRSQPFGMGSPSK